MFNNFYKQSVQDIAKLVKKYLEENLLSSNIELKQAITVTISGSIASGHYDQYSDIDLDLYCQSDAAVDRFKETVSDFKESISNKGDIPIQVHRLKSLTKVKEVLTKYNDDNMLREVAQSIIIIDPQGEFTTLQSKFDWYPEDVAKEKLRWLYAQLVFEYEEHFKVAADRDDAYYLQVSKLNVLRLAGNAFLLVNKKWPAFDKHLFASLKDVDCDETLLKLLESTLTTDISDIKCNVKELVRSIEAYLVGRDLIPQEPTRYWIDLRPTYSVSLG